MVSSIIRSNVYWNICFLIYIYFILLVKFYSILYLRTCVGYIKRI